MTIKHEFVDYVPETLAGGVVYVSLRFGTIVHLCACGCGNEVVTPLSPTDWELTYDGESISLFPSIGNWSLECRSHYWIVNSEIEWAARWSDDSIAAVRLRDQVDKAQFYARRRRMASGASDDKRGRGSPAEEAVAQGTAPTKKRRRRR